MIRLSPADLEPLGTLVGFAALGGYCGLHLQGVLAVSPGLWRLPPTFRGRAAGSLHRFAGRPRALLGGLALLGLGIAALARGASPDPSRGLLLGALGLTLSAVLAALPALPLERRMGRLFYEAADASRDREFIRDQARWDRWQSLRLLLSGAATALLAVRWMAQT